MAQKSKNKEERARWYLNYLAGAYNSAQNMQRVAEEQIVKFGMMHNKTDVHTVYKEGLDALSKHCDSIILNLNRALRIIRVEEKERLNNKKLEKADEDFQRTIKEIQSYEASILSSGYYEIKMGMYSDRRSAMESWLDWLRSVNIVPVRKVSRLLEEYKDLLHA